MDCHHFDPGGGAIFANSLSLKKKNEFGAVGGLLGVLVVLSTVYKETFHMKGPCLKMGRAHNLAGSAGNHPALLHARWLSDSCAQSFHEIGTITITEELRVLIQDFSYEFFKMRHFLTCTFYRSHPNSQIQQLFLTKSTLASNRFVASFLMFSLESRFRGVREKQ